MLAGCISEAIRLVETSYPGLLASSPELLFKLKCRQFIEIVGGYDRGEVGITLEPRLSCHSELSNSNPASPNSAQPTNQRAATMAATSSVAMEEGTRSSADRIGMNIYHKAFSTLCHNIAE